ncbi:hydroxyacylglutathione hydrolase [Pelotomaculum sp. FP]|uniref:MBL fold metallo-hydrolase n=1 Tax=Pelotomaculum sp. FP TaxID=261474 RepID=UPI0010653756|nr:MBL fold metallo-hydrolase [Pelotomaculum sp. FP]TEB15003.1 hydroxyacylglutathione hydrolase [Pelotomaculum sp. FP]
MIEEILPDIYKIEIPLPRNPLKYLNSYLIKGSERNLLIDTGFNQEECRKAMFEGLEKLEVNLEQTDFFITHMHADHSGLVTTLATDHSKVYCSEIDAHVINFGVSGVFFSEMHRLLIEHGLPLQEADKAIEEHPAKKYNMGKTQVFNTVKDNDLIKVGDYIFKCVHTPGHSPGHMCLYEEDKKILISGDHILDEITPVIVFTIWASNPLRDYFNSLVKTEQLETSLTLPAHRRIITNVQKRIHELKEHHDIRLIEILNILFKGEMTAYQVAAKMTWDVKYSTWEQFPVNQKYFATIEAISHLNYLCHKNMVRKTEKEGKFLFELIDD